MVELHHEGSAINRASPVRFQIARLLQDLVGFWLPGLGFWIYESGSGANILCQSLIARVMKQALALQQAQRLSA